MLHIDVEEILSLTTEMLSEITPIVFPLFLTVVLVMVAIKVALNLLPSQHASSFSERKPKDEIELVSWKPDTNNIKYAVFVPYLEKKNTLFGFLGNATSYNYIKIGNRYHRRDEKEYIFNTSISVFNQIKKDIFKPIKSFKDFTLIPQFHDEIHYVLANLSELSNLEVDMKKEVIKASEFILEIKKYADEIQSAAQQKTIEFKKEHTKVILEKHHLNLDHITTKAKILNTNFEGNVKNIDNNKD